MLRRLPPQPAILVEMHAPIARIAILFLGLVTALSGLVGCASKAPSQFTITQDQYPALFETVTQTLIDWRFELDQIDYKTGLITTKPKQTSGLATPWDDEQTSPGDEIEDVLNRHTRSARIAFTRNGQPLAADPVQASSTPQPLGPAETSNEPITVTIEVARQRYHRPNWRVESMAVRYSTFARNPIAPQGQAGPFLATLDRDEPLARRLAGDIARRLNLPIDESSATVTTAPASPPQPSTP